MQQISIKKKSRDENRSAFNIYVNEMLQWFSSVIACKISRLDVLEPIMSIYEMKKAPISWGLIFMFYAVLQLSGFFYLLVSFYDIANFNIVKVLNV